MKLYFVLEGPAVQINLLLLFEFIPPLLSQSEACYDLTQPCKSLGIGLPEDKRSLSFSKLWLINTLQNQVTGKGVRPRSVHGVPKQQG